MDAGIDAGLPAPVNTVVFDWYLRGAVEEYSIGAAATATHIVWVRYVSGPSGKLTTLVRATGALVTTAATDLAPYNVVSSGNTVGFLGRGVQSISDWRVQWIDETGTASVRSNAMDVVVTGASFVGAMYPEADAGLKVHVSAPKNSSGTHVSAITSQDGGVQRTENTCGNTFWWDAATADGSNRRFFIGGVNLQPCNLGNGQYVTAPVGQVQLVLVRYSGVNGPGVPTVRELTAASKTLAGPAALGATADAVWIAYYAPSGHLRLERYSPDTVNSQGAVQAAGQAYVTASTTLGLQVLDVVPHPVRDRVYVLSTVLEPKSTWGSEVFPTFNQPTLAIFLFEASTRKLLGVWWVPSTNAPKSGSSMALIDERLVVSGQCDATPAAGTTDLLCNPGASGFPSSFLFAFPAP